MRPANQIEVMLLIELFNDVLAERVAHTPLVLAPCCHLFVGVAPQQVAEKTVVRHVNRSVEILDLFETVEIRTQSSVHAKNPLLNKRTHRHVIETITKLSPQADRVPAFAFIVKTISAVDGLAFVVASQKIK